MSDPFFTDCPGFQRLSQRALVAESALLDRSCCPTHDLVAIVAQNGRSISLWRMTGSASASTPVWTLQGLDGVVSLAWSPDGLILAIAHGNKVTLQSIHPPSSVSHRQYPTITFKSSVEVISWHDINVPSVETQNNLAFVKRLYQLRDPASTVVASSLLTPVSDEIDLNKRSPTLLDSLAPDFPRLLEGEVGSLLCVVENHRLHTMLGGAVALGPWLELREGRASAIELLSAADVLHVDVYTCAASGQINRQRYSLQISDEQQHLAQAVNHAHSLLNAALGGVDEAKRQWTTAQEVGRAWLSKMERPRVEDALMQVLVTGRAPYESVKECLASKAAERAYQKWETTAFAAQSQLVDAAYQLAAPACERIITLFGRWSIAVYEQAEATLRKALALEEATRTERRMFTEVAKFFRHELDRHNRMDMEPPPANAAREQPVIPPLVPAVHHPLLVAKWLKVSRPPTEEEDIENHLFPWIDALIESLGQLARVVRDECLSKMISGGGSALRYHETSIIIDRMGSARWKVATSSKGEARLASADKERVSLYRADRELTTFALTDGNQMFECRDLGFFDDNELALLLLDARHRPFVATLALSCTSGQHGRLPVKRCHYLEHPSSLLSLALNGRVGRRTGCAVSSTFLEVYDMDEDDAIDEDL